jgi:hypothetical protein
MTSPVPSLLSTMSSMNSMWDADKDNPPQWERLILLLLWYYLVLGKYITCYNTSTVHVSAVVGRQGCFYLFLPSKHPFYKILRHSCMKLNMLYMTTLYVFTFIQVQFGLQSNTRTKAYNQMLFGSMIEGRKMKCCRMMK